MTNYGTPPPPIPTPHDVTDAPTSPSCTACGSASLEQGFIEDNGEGSRGYARWIPGSLELGIFGGASRMGRPRFEVVTLRCTRCQHLELYVGGQV